jgi:hypothetical protein
MVLFPLYAVFIWYFCFRWRRSWVGWGALFLGVLGVGVLAWVHRMLTIAFSGDFENPMLFQLLLAAEAGLVLFVGGFIVLLPMEVADTPCRGCSYDLAGLEEDNPTCPECGMVHAARKVRRRVCRGCGVEMFLVRGDNPTCPSCGIVHSVREIRPDTPPVVLPAIVDVLRWLRHPRTSRYKTPSSSTPAGTPKIVVIRRADNTFVS